MWTLNPLAYNAGVCFCKLDLMGAEGRGENNTHDN